MLPAPPTTAGYYREIAVLACRLSDQPEKDIKGDAEQWSFKTANVMKHRIPRAVWMSLSEITGQSDERFLQPTAIVDISDKMKEDGRLEWDAPRAFGWFYGSDIQFSTRCAPISLGGMRSIIILARASRSSSRFPGSTSARLGPTYMKIAMKPTSDLDRAFCEEFRKRCGYDLMPWLPVWPAVSWKAVLSATASCTITARRSRTFTLRTISAISPSV